MSRYEPYLSPDYAIDERTEAFVYKRLGTEQDVEAVADDLM